MLYFNALFVVYTVHKIYFNTMDDSFLLMYFFNNGFVNAINIVSIQQKENNSIFTRLYLYINT